MFAYGSNEELIKLLNICKDKDYIECNFLSWFNLYPNIFDVILNYQYNELFDSAIKKNMREIIGSLIKWGELNKINNLIYKYKNEIFDNIDIILDNDPDYKTHFYALTKLEGFDKCVQNQEEKILNKALGFNQFEAPLDYAINLLFLLSSLPFFSFSFANQNKAKIENFINMHFNMLDPACYDGDLLSQIFEMIVNSCKKHLFINEFFGNHIEYIATIFSNKRLVTLKREKILDFYVELIKDIIRIESADIKDMDLKKGMNSRVLIIKDKVLKSGRKYTKKIPYHKRLLQPIMRMDVDYIDSNIFSPRMDFVEVYERVEKIKEDLNQQSSDDIVYNIFKEMLEDGVLWGDPQVANLGILLKPNLPFHEETGYNDDKFYVDDVSVGIYNYGPKEILDKGEIVVCDLDCLYYSKKISELMRAKAVLAQACGQSKKRFDVRNFYEIGMSNINYGRKFEMYLNRYYDELKQSIDKEKKV